jgi:hypothetical protein
MVGSTNFSQRRSEECCLDTTRFNECLYYLRAYGTPGARVAFLVKHNCFKEACRFLLDSVSRRERRKGRREGGREGREGKGGVGVGGGGERGKRIEGGMD